MTMDVHSRYRTSAHNEVVSRFNERFILSLTDCNECVVIDDQLNILPISSHVFNLEPLPPALKVGMTTYFLYLNLVGEIRKPSRT